MHYYALYKSFNLYNRCSIGGAWNVWQSSTRLQCNDGGFSFSISINNNNNNINNLLNAVVNTVVNNYKHTSCRKGCTGQVKFGKFFRKRDLLCNRLTSCDVSCCFAITFNNKINISITTSNIYLESTKNFKKNIFNIFAANKNNI